MSKIDELKADKRFKDLIPLSEEQFKAYEQSSIEMGELHSPIIYWLGVCPSN